MNEESPPPTVPPLPEELLNVKPGYYLFSEGGEGKTAVDGHNPFIKLHIENGGSLHSYLDSVGANTKQDGF